VAQAVAYGARLVQVRAGFDRALQLAREIAAGGGAVLVNSLNPLRPEGQKTAAFEVVDALDDPPDYLVLPVGNAGNISSYWRGFSQYLALGRIAARPSVVGVQASGADPLVIGHPLDEPRTDATAIRIGSPAGWDGALQVREQSGGMFMSVPDERIFAAQRLLASEEGVFAEPASAAAVAGVISLVETGALRRGATVVAVLTGNGLKDPEAVLRGLEVPEPVEPTISAVSEAAAGAAGAAGVAETAMTGAAVWRTPA
jgi:threonine synthase